MPSPVTTTPATSLRLPASWRQSKNPSIIGCVHALSFFWLANVMVMMPFAPRLVSSGICGVCSRARDRRHRSRVRSAAAHRLGRRRAEAAHGRGRRPEEPRVHAGGFSSSRTRSRAVLVVAQDVCNCATDATLTPCESTFRYKHPICESASLVHEPSCSFARQPSSLWQQPARRLAACPRHRSPLCAPAVTPWAHHVTTSCFARRPAA